MYIEQNNLYIFCFRMPGSNCSDMDISIDDEALLLKDDDEPMPMTTDVQTLLTTPTTNHLNLASTSVHKDVPKPLMKVRIPMSSILVPRIRIQQPHTIPPTFRKTNLFRAYNLRGDVQPICFKCLKIGHVKKYCDKK